MAALSVTPNPNVSQEFLGEDAGMSQGLQMAT